MHVFAFNKMKENQVYLSMDTNSAPPKILKGLLTSSPFLSMCFLSSAETAYCRL